MVHVHGNEVGASLAGISLFSDVSVPKNQIRLRKSARKNCFMFNLALRTLF